MPKVARELSAISVKRLREEGLHAVGGVPGLYLQVRNQGSSRSWILRAKVCGSRRDMGLGPYPEVSLADARAEAKRLRAEIRAGRDPLADKEAARSAALRSSMTFRKVFDAYASEKGKEYKSFSDVAHWRSAVERYAMPILGDVRVAEITRDDILKVLTPIWHEKTPTATKLRERLEGVLSFATIQGYRDGENPAKWVGNLKLLLANPSKINPRQHYPAIPLRDAQRWWRDLVKRDGLSALALQFQAMTASRSGAVRFATWSEINFFEKLWTIQPGRKASKIPIDGRPHRVPLTPQMIDLLGTVPRVKNQDLIFTAPRGGAFSDAAFGGVMKKIHHAALKQDGTGYVDERTGEPAVPHGLRTTFKSWAIELTDYPDEMSELALAHTVGSKVAQAYDRTDRLEKRRDMAQAWVKFLMGD